jgi:hypothetical protein
MPRYFNQIFDKMLELRDRAAAAITVNTAETPKQIPVRKSFYYRAIGNVSAYTGYTAGTNYWAIAIEASPAAGGTYTEVARFNSLGVADQFQLGMSGPEIEAKVPTAEFVRARAFIVGTGVGAMSYGLFLTKGEV